MAFLSFSFFLVCLVVGVTLMWLIEIRLLLFLIVVEFTIFFGVLSTMPEWCLGGESIIIFVVSGCVLSLLLLLISSSARKFGLYSSEV